MNTSLAPDNIEFQHLGFRNTGIFRLSAGKSSHIFPNRNELLIFYFFQYIRRFPVHACQGKSCYRKTFFIFNVTFFRSSHSFHLTTLQDYQNSLPTHIWTGTLHSLPLETPSQWRVFVAMTTVGCLSVSQEGTIYSWPFLP